MTRWVKNLLIANIGMFFVQQTMPGVTDALMFVPIFALRQPWTIITYMFLHGSFMHILFNMFGLFFFGSRVEQRLGANRFLWLYFFHSRSVASRWALLNVCASLALPTFSTWSG